MIIVFVILILVFSVTVEAKSKKSSKSKNKAKTKGDVRLIAHTNDEVSKALQKGCKIVREARTLKAVLCPKDAVSSLGLKEDMKVHTLDAQANTQIKADLVHVSGNTGAGRKIVVLDTGIEYTHSLLSSSYLGGYDFVNNDNDPMDDNGHGTEVAGIITADFIGDPNLEGVAPDAGVIAGKVADALGSAFTSDIVAGIYWAVDGPDGVYGTADDFKADAISISLGTIGIGFKRKCDDFDPDSTAAVEYAVSKNVLVVIGAGNEGEEGVSSPGCINDAITVGAVDSSDVIADFSSRGRAVDVVAPGVNIYTTVHGNAAFVSGTSFATPMVSGTIALIKAAHPGYTAQQTADALLNTAIDLGLAGRDTQYGRRGRIDANAAVNYVAS